MLNYNFDFCFPIILIAPRKRQKRLLTFGWEVWTSWSPTTKGKTGRGNTRLARVGNCTSITRNTQVVSEVSNTFFSDLLDKSRAYCSTWTHLISMYGMKKIYPYPCWRRISQREETGYFQTTSFLESRVRALGTRLKCRPALTFQHKLINTPPTLHPFKKGTRNAGTLDFPI